MVSNFFGKHPETLETPRNIGNTRAILHQNWYWVALQHNRISTLPPGLFVKKPGKSPVAELNPLTIDNHRTNAPGMRVCLFPLPTNQNWVCLFPLPNEQRMQKAGWISNARATSVVAKVWIFGTNGQTMLSDSCTIIRSIYCS